MHWDPRQGKISLGSHFEFTGLSEDAKTATFKADCTGKYRKLLIKATKELCHRMEDMSGWMEFADVQIRKYVLSETRILDIYLSNAG